MSKALIFALLLPLFLLGCVTSNPLSQSKKTPWPWKDKAPCEKTCQNDIKKTCYTCNSSDAIKEYHTAVEFCSEIHNSYESSSKRANGTRFGISLLGTLAGSVFAPISGDKAAAAWSGISGASNAASSSFDSAFSEATYVSKRAAVAKAASIASDKYIAVEKSNYNDKVRASIDMARDCAMSSSIVDQTTMQAALGASNNTDITDSSLDLANAELLVSQDKFEKIKLSIKELENKKIKAEEAKNSEELKIVTQQLKEEKKELDKQKNLVDLAKAKLTIKKGE